MSLMQRDMRVLLIMLVLALYVLLVVFLVAGLL